MIRDRLRRFRNIERARGPGAETEPGPSPRRFERVEGPGPASVEPAIPESATDRFRPPRERPLEVAERPDGEQPFRRCARCETDSARFAETCQNCGADLSTPEQQGFNERLWSRRCREAAEEARALAGRERERDRLAAEEQAARRALAVEMARREADRIEGELGGAWGRPGRSSPGMRLVRAIRNPVLRVAVILTAVALPVGLVVAGRPGGGLRVAGMLGVAALLGLLAPPGWLRRSRWRGW
jgi:hypothetical protein